MVQEDEYIQVLMKLGLTFLESRTYLTLVRFEKADVKTIFKASKIARQDVYRVMPTLEKLGLAQEILGKPTMYKATPMKQAYHLLLQDKRQKHLELEKKARDLIKDLDEDNNRETPKEDKPEFVINYSEDLLLSWINGITNSAQMNIDIMCKWKMIRYRFFNYAPEIRAAMNRNVKFRIITEKQENDRSVEKIVQTLGQNPLFEIRFLVQPVPVEMIICDRQEVVFCIAITPDNNGVPNLWSNHPQFLKVMTGYFQATWEREARQVNVLTKTVALH